jgi:site-specific recombinase XerD
MKTIASTTALERLVLAYQEHLLRDAGLTASTCRVRLMHLRAFLTAQFKPREELDLNKLTPAVLLHYVLAQRPRLGLGSLQAVTGSLRSFCRFLCLSGRVERDLSTAVPRVAAPPEPLPGFLSPRQVDQLVKSLRGPTPAHQRDYAVVLCLARLGVRAGELTRLTLDDINWRAGTLRLTRTKGRRERQLPLPAEVGRALAEYVTQARPRTSARQVFVTLQQGTPLSSNGLSTLTTRAMKRAGLVGSRFGPHLLRHTLASHLVQRGATLKAVADLLGHLSLNTTQIYAKVNLPLLRQVAAPWPKEVGR